MAKNLILDEDYSIVESGIVCREGESVQVSNVEVVVVGWAKVFKFVVIVHLYNSSICLCS